MEKTKMKSKTKQVKEEKCGCGNNQCKGDCSSKQGGCCGSGGCCG